MTAPSVRLGDDVRPGDALPPVIRTPSEVSLFLFSGVTWNPHRIHYDAPYAASEGYEAPLVQGHMHGALLVRCVMDWMGPQGLLETFGYQNRRYAIAGDTLTARGTVGAVMADADGFHVEIDLVETNQRDEECVRGHARVRLPRRGG